MVRVDVDAREVDADEGEEGRVERLKDFVGGIVTRAWHGVQGKGADGLLEVIPRGVYVEDGSLVNMELQRGTFYGRMKSWIPRWMRLGRGKAEKGKAEPPWGETMARSWFGRVQKVVRAKHYEWPVTWGPEVNRVGAHWVDWEEFHQKELRRLVKVLQRMRMRVWWVLPMEGNPEGNPEVRRAALVCESVRGEAVLRVYGVKGDMDMDTVDDWYGNKFW
jgi:hypothetical protein